MKVFSFKLLLANGEIISRAEWGRTRKQAIKTLEGIYMDPFIILWHSAGNIITKNPKCQIIAKIKSKSERITSHIPYILYYYISLRRCRGLFAALPHH